MRLDVNAFLVKIALAASRWPRLTIAVWVLVLVFAVGVAARFGDRFEGGFGNVPGSPSAHVDTVLAEKFDQPFSQFIAVILTPTATRPTGDLTSAARKLQTALNDTPAVRRTMLGPTSKADRAVILVGLRAQSLAAAERLVPRVRTRIRAWEAGRTDVMVTTTGVAAFDVDVAEYATAEASSGERRVVPVMLLTLLVIFGSLAAAAIPLAIGLAAVLSTVGVLGAIACCWPLSVFATNIASMVGLGLGIDYSLLVISRWREIRETGASPHEALQATLIATTPTLAASGLTVAVALAAILWVPVLDAQGLGAGGMVVALLAVLAGMTLLPALLTLAGPRLDRAPWLPGYASAKHRASAWEARVRTIIARPKTYLFGGLTLLVILSMPASHLRFAFPEVSQVPESLEAVRGWHLLGDVASATEITPIRIIIEAPDAILSAKRLQGVAALSANLRTRPWVNDVRSPITGASNLWLKVARAAGPERLRRLLPEAARWYVDHDGQRLLVDIIVTPQTTNLQAKDYVRALRQETWDRFPELTDCRITVGGPAAQALDIDDAVIQAGPIVAGSVVIVTLFMLFGLTRSFLLPLKAVAANVFTVTAALGVTIGLFQTDACARFMGLSGALPGVPPGLVLLLFCVVFGLSMDYEIFLLHRVVEGHRAGMDDAAAITHGVGRSAGIISGGALLMILVFAGFSLTDLAVVKMLGVSLAVGVLLDATLVRLILVPAFMMVAGRYNWLPGFPRTNNRNS